MTGDAPTVSPMLQMAQAGDLGAQRQMVAMLMASVRVGMTTPVLDEARMWAVRAAQQGEASDLVVWASVTVASGQDAEDGGNLDAARTFGAQLLAILTKLCNADGWRHLAATLLMQALSDATISTIALARDIAAEWEIDPAPLDRALGLAETPPSLTTSDVATLAAYRALTHRIASHFDLDVETARALVADTPGDRVELLSSPEGWAEMMASVAEHLGVPPPPVTFTLH